MARISATPTWALVLVLGLGCGRTEPHRAISPPVPCTPCDRACQIERCLRTRRPPTLLASGDAGFPAGIARSHAEVFWLINGDHFTPTGLIMRAPLKGGPATVLASGQLVPWELTADAEGVWWSTSGRNDGGTIMFAPHDGGLPRTVAKGATSANGIAVSASYVYWTDGQGLQRIAKQGSAVEIIAGRAFPWAVATDDVHVYWWGEGNVLSRIPIAGGAPAALATDREEPRPIAVHHGTVFWTNLGPPGDDGNCSVLSVPAEGGDVTVIARHVDASFGVAADETHVYWVGGGTSAGRYRDGMIMRCPAGGCDACLESLEVLACEQSRSFNIVLDDERIYWTSDDGIRALAKVP